MPREVCLYLAQPSSRQHILVRCVRVTVLRPVGLNILGFPRKRPSPGSDYLLLSLVDTVSLNVRAKNSAITAAKPHGIYQIVDQSLTPLFVNASTIIPESSEPTPMPTP